MATSVRDVMTPQCESVAQTDTVHEVARKMRTLMVTALPVCDERGRLCGIISLRGIGVTDVLGGIDSARTTAGSLAEEPSITVGVDELVDDIGRLMAEKRLWMLPVLDGLRLVGVIHYANVLSVMGCKGSAGVERVDQRLPAQRSAVAATTARDPAVARV